MTLKSDIHSNYDAHDTLQCQILHQNDVLYTFYFYSEGLGLPKMAISLPVACKQLTKLNF